MLSYAIFYAALHQKKIVAGKNLLLTRESAEGMLQPDACLFPSREQSQASK
jgi:hypothetical protein